MAGAVSLVRVLPLVAVPFAVAALLAAAQGSQGQVVITNGMLALGVNPEGDLNVPGAKDCVSPALPGSFVGLRYLPTNCDGVGYGCQCEGWGASYNEAVSGVASRDPGMGGVNLPCGHAPVQTTPATNRTQTSAWVCDLRVDHDFHPSATPNLYEVDVFLTNVGQSDLSDVTYRRAMDFDAEPTPTENIITIDGRDLNPKTPGMDYTQALQFSHDDGQGPLNPLAPVPLHGGGCTEMRSIPDYPPLLADGPCNHGAVFQLHFGWLEPGERASFKIYYGAAQNRTAALQALVDVQAEFWALGECSPASESGGAACAAQPNTFIFGFGDVARPQQRPQEPPEPDRPVEPRKSQDPGTHDDQEGDQDEDGVPDEADNCPEASNPGQEDADGDGQGDACDGDPPEAPSAAPGCTGDPGLDAGIEGCPVFEDRTQEPAAALDGPEAGRSIQRQEEAADVRPDPRKASLPWWAVAAVGGAALLVALMALGTRRNARRRR